MRLPAARYDRAGDVVRSGARLGEQRARGGPDPGPVLVRSDVAGRSRTLVEELLGQLENDRQEIDETLDRSIVLRFE
jgi:hypothetical protein